LTAHAALAARFGASFSTNETVRAQHGGGEGFRAGGLPDAVVFAKSDDDAADVFRICAEHRTPVIAFGTGTSLEGQLHANVGSISVDVSQMDAILSVNAGDLDCRVQAGVTREALNHHIRNEGLFFPLDPGANASLGGMAATRASGTNAVRYGTMRDVTLGLTVVTPQGEIIRTGGRARKSSTGYDLTRLYIGSEGTLGIITELQLRLFGIPEKIAAAVCPFDTLEGAVESVTLILQLGIPLARIELLDALQMRACIAYSKLEGFAEAPTLFLEFHGSKVAVADQIEQVRAVVGDFGGGDLRWATAQEERTALWTARHNAYWAARGLIAGHESFATDACVPISALPSTIAEASAAAREAGLTAPITGHVGDGNFHMLVLYDPTDMAMRARASALSDTVACLAISNGGTMSGEHGVGLRKRGLMKTEHDAGALNVMRRIKAALDPMNIANPGKLIPD